MDGMNISTYSDLQTIAQQFADSQVNLLLLIGRPGLMKTETFKHACLGEPALFISGKKAPLDLYIDLYAHRNQLVVLDDVEPLLDNKDGQVLIRGLTETTKVKRISWGTRTSLLNQDSKPVPRSFLTSSRVCIIANKWKSNGIFEAIESRAIKFTFTPSWAEVYTEAGKWFHDQEVLDYVYNNISTMKNPDARLLNKAVEIRKLGLQSQDWRAVFDACMDSDAVDREVMRLLADTALTQTERVAQFEAGGFGDRATFFRRRKKLLDIQAVPLPTRIVVSTQPSQPQPYAVAGGGDRSQRVRRKRRHALALYTK